jgi:hypothetical protein
METTQTETTQTTAKAPESFSSFAETLDKALSAATFDKPEPIKTQAPTPEPAKTETATQETPAQKPEAAPAPAKEDSKFLTPPSLLDKLGKIGVPGEAGDTAPTAQNETGDLEKTPENLNTSAQTAFAKLTKELRDAKSKLKEFESKISARTEVVEDKGGDVETDSQLNKLQKQLEEFKAEREELESELRLSRVEATREYKVNIGDPTRAAKQTISDIAKSYELRESGILDTLSEVDGAKRRAMLKELTSDMDPVDALTVRTKIDELLVLNGKREEMVKDSQRILEEISKQEQEQEKAQRAKFDLEAKNAFGEVWSLFEKELPLIQKVEGNDQWNKMVDGLRAEAERLDSEPLDHKRRAALTFQAVTLPLVVQVFNDYVQKTNKEMSSLRASLGDYRKATPSAGSGQTPDKSDKKDPALSFLDAIG